MGRRTKCKRARAEGLKRFGIDQDKIDHMVKLVSDTFSNDLSYDELVKRISIDNDREIENLSKKLVIMKEESETKLKFRQLAYADDNNNLMIELFLRNELTVDGYIEIAVRDYRTERFVVVGESNDKDLFLAVIVICLNIIYNFNTEAGEVQFPIGWLISKVDENLVKPCNGISPTLSELHHRPPFTLSEKELKKEIKISNFSLLA